MCAFTLALATALALIPGALATDGGNADAVWPTWTPLPTATKRVYPSWTPVPTATRRATATPTRSATRTATPEGPDLEATSLPSLTPKPCDAPWEFTQAERYRIQAAGMWHLRGGPEIDLIPQHDALCGIGLYTVNLGAPLTIEYTVEGDVQGDVIRCRGFCMGVVAVMERQGTDATCRFWGAISWGGEQIE